MLAARAALLVPLLAATPRAGLVARDSAAVSVLAFCCGMAWMDLCADELVSVFQALAPAAAHIFLRCA